MTTYSPGTFKYAITLVMPVYNEVESIKKVLTDWSAQLEQTCGSYQIVVVDDGSTDGTGRVLEECAKGSAIRLVQQANSGHGPSIIVGYKQACADSEWVFQCDSDDEISSDEFPKFWEARTDTDAVLGVRSGRDQSAVRSLVTQVCRWVTGANDPNVPFRLLRSTLLKQCLEDVPKDSFAPNTMITYGFTKQYRTKLIGCQVRERAHGKASLNDINILPAAARSLIQLLCYMRHLRRSGRNATSN